MRIYVASKAEYAANWRVCRVAGLNIISTWIDTDVDLMSSEKEVTDLWNRRVLEISSSDVLIVYKAPEETLQSVLVEVGCALAFGKPVLAVGCDDMSFTWHPLVTKCPDLEAALKMIKTLEGNRE